MAPSAVLAGLLLIVSFAMSHSIVHIDKTDWKEPVLNWICIAMQTGMRKSTLCKYLKHILKEAQKHCAGDRFHGFVTISLLKRWATSCHVTTGS